MSPYSSASLAPTPSFGLLRQPREVLYGAGQRTALVPVVLALGNQVVLVTDERMAGDPFFNHVVIALRRGGASVTVFDQVTPDLPVGDVEAAVAHVRGSEAPDPEVVVGIGGGSCLDLAKVLALVLRHGGSPRDYYGEFAVPGPTIPVVAVPTTAGTGSEVTPVAVLSDPEAVMKVGISSPHLIPHTAVVDPVLSGSCPSGLSAASGADALSHLVESFTANRHEPTSELYRERVFVGKGALTDAYARHGLELVGRSLRTCVHTGGEGPHRDDMAMAALCGGFALGTAGTAVAHAFQYPIGALTHTAHGVGVGCLLPYAMAFNAEARPEEISEIGRLLGAGEDVTPQGAVRAVADLLSDIGIPATLADLGVTRDQLDEIAENGLRARRLVQNNPVPLGAVEARELVELAFTGQLP